MTTLEKIFGGLIGLAVVVALVSSKANTGQVAQDVFGGTSQLFGTILSPVGATAVNPTGS